jgi:transposase-like protein
MKLQCKYCKSSNLIKKGKAKTKSELKQIYLCKNCSKKFTFSSAPNKTYTIKIISESLSTYNMGFTLKQTVERINKKFKTRISISTLHEWLKEYKSLIPYLKQRNIFVKIFDVKKLITKKTFEHSGLHYYFRFHNAKLDHLCSDNKFKSLRKYILELVKGCPDFFSRNRRCSLLKVNIEVETKRLFNLACKMTDFALKAVTLNTERHKAIENFMLLNDSTTIAVEVPVWFWEKSINEGISGHIDILQVRNNKVYILDYKPEAEKDKKAIGQLFLYAQALALRLGFKLDDFMCAWFDDENYYEFNPALAKYKGLQV